MKFLRCTPSYKYLIVVIIHEQRPTSNGLEVEVLLQIQSSSGSPYTLYIAETLKPSFHLDVKCTRDFNIEELTIVQKRK